MKPIPESELIINSDGSIFHLHLKPEHIAKNIILVGDQGRVATVSSFFDKIDIKIQNREFVTHTGTYKGNPISVISTGIGTDNIDIVVNELDAIVNIDLKTRLIKDKHTKLNFIRIGTSGALQEDIPVDSFLMSKMAVGFDGMLNYYADREKVSNIDIEKKFIEFVNWNPNLAKPYFVNASDKLISKLGKDIRKGITISAPGFYGPQGRVLRVPVADPELNNKISRFDYNGDKITNYEMESSAIFGLSAYLGHEAVTVCAIIANRLRKEYSKDYKPVIKDLIKTVLDRLFD
ncbi:MAG: nucleoside phosphorylase [Marinilabiliales bacterium]